MSFFTTKVIFILLKVKKNILNIISFLISTIKKFISKTNFLKYVFNLKAYYF